MSAACNSDGVKHPLSPMANMSNFTQGLIRLVQFANRFNTPSSSKQFCKPFFIEDKHVGFIRPDVLQFVKEHPDVFDLHHNSQTGDIIKVQLSLELKTFEDRSEKLAAVLQQWRQEDEDLISLAGWRDETYNVYYKFSEPPLMKMERSATCLFGLKQYGVHINAYTHRDNEGLCMWIAKRSKTKQTWPGKLDQMVAGGLASNETIMECARKECKEEASVPEELIAKLKPCGTVSYFYEDERGLFPECQFVMDLEVPEDFKPVNADGEVESFQLLPIEKLKYLGVEMESKFLGSKSILAQIDQNLFKDWTGPVKKLMITDDFKFNCAIVILDFLIRHSLLLPDDEPFYTYLMESIHVTLH